MTSKFAASLRRTTMSTDSAVCKALNSLKANPRDPLYMDMEASLSSNNTQASSLHRAVSLHRVVCLHREECLLNINTTPTSNVRSQFKHLM